MVTSNRRWGLRWSTYACRRATALMRSHGRFTLTGPPSSAPIGPAGARLGRSWCAQPPARWLSAPRRGSTAGAGSWTIGLLGAGCGAAFVGEMEEHRFEVVAAEAGDDLV